VGVGLGVASRYGLIDRWGWLLVFLVPACICHVNTGYFAWLTHQRVSGGRFEALNNVANVLAVLSHNQGFHSVHHKHPSLHWTEIPDHVGEMLDVSDSLIVPYWMTMTSAWRALHPAGVLAPMFGGAWKTRCRRALSAQRHRARRVPYFCWID
jgi:fatty acid desaturase